MEVVVTGAVYNKTNTWVFEHNGSLRPGWPQLTNDSGYAYGVFNDTAALGDLDGDGLGEIVVPSDVHYVCAYEADGGADPRQPHVRRQRLGQGWCLGEPGYRAARLGHLPGRRLARRTLPAQLRPYPSLLSQM